MTSSPAKPLIILGASARAAAQWALRQGFAPWCIDLFADRDLRAIAEVRQCPADQYPHAMIDMLDEAPVAPVLLTGRMEEYPDVVEAIAARRPLLHATPRQIGRVRGPGFLRLPDTGETITKRDGAVQPFIRGRSVSAVIMDGKVVGVTEQIVNGMQYVGSMGPIDVDHEQLILIIERCDLPGLYGIDMIEDAHGDLFPVEINPRFTASVEIHNRSAGCMHGKLIVFAREDLVAPDLYDLYDRDEVADVPEVGETIRAGQPVCTVFAAAGDRDACLARLHELEQRVYTAAVT